MRVDDVRAALVPPGRPDGQVLDGHHRGEPIEVLGVADADAPAAVRAGPAARDDIAAGIDAEVRGAGGGQPLRGAVDGPALDQAGRVQPAGGPRREEAARGPLEGEAAREDLVDLGAALGDGQLAASRRLMSLSSR